MAESWYFTKNGQPMDPVPLTELKRLAASGELKPTDLVWKDGMPNWVKASEAKGLFDQAPAGNSAAVVTRAAAKPSRVEEEPPGERRRLIDDDDEADERPRRKSALRSALDDEWNEEDEERPRRRRRRDEGDGEEDDERPRRRKPKKEGISAGALIGMIGGGAVALIVLIGVIVAIGRLGGPPSKEGSYNWSLATNDKATYTVRTLAGHRLELRVKSTGRSDVDLFVFEGNNKIMEDIGDSSDCFLSFTPANEKTLRVEVVNRQLIGPGVDVARNGANSGTFTYKQIEQNKGANNNNAPPNDNPVTFNSVLALGSRKTFAVKLEANVTYTIELSSNTFDTYLELQNPGGLIVAQNDDIDEAGDNLNSRIIFAVNPPNQPGVYLVVVSSFQNGGAGLFTLTVRH